MPALEACDLLVMKTLGRVSCRPIPNDYWNRDIWTSPIPFLLLKQKTKKDLQSHMINIGYMQQVVDLPQHINNPIVTNY